MQWNTCTQYWVYYNFISKSIAIFLMIAMQWNTCTCIKWIILTDLSFQSKRMRWDLPPNWTPVQQAQAPCVAGGPPHDLYLVVPPVSRGPPWEYTCWKWWASFLVWILHLLYENNLHFYSLAIKKQGIHKTINNHILGRILIENKI